MAPKCQARGINWAASGINRLLGELAADYSTLLCSRPLDDGVILIGLEGLARWNYASGSVDWAGARWPSPTHRRVSIP